jgi:hypothetical protein
MDTKGCKYNAWQLGYELGGRGNVRFITRSYHRANEGQHEVITIAMTGIKRESNVTAFMQQVSLSSFGLTSWIRNHAGMHFNT